MKHFFFLCALLAGMTAAAQPGCGQDKIAIFGGLELQYSNQTPAHPLGLGINLAAGTQDQMVLAQLSWVQFGGVPSASARLTADIGQAWASVFRRPSRKKWEVWPSLQGGLALQWTGLASSDNPLSSGVVIAAGLKVRTGKSWFSLHGEAGTNDGYGPDGYLTQRLAVRAIFTRQL